MKKRLIPGWFVFALVLGISGTAGWTQSSAPAEEEFPAKVTTWHNMKDDGDGRYSLENGSEYGWLICYAQDGASIKSIKVVYYSKQDEIPALAVKTPDGNEKFFRPETTDELKINPMGGGVSSLVLDSSIPDDANQAVLWLNAGSDVEIRRVVLKYH